MAYAASIRIVKQQTIRGSLKQWSNRYHFTNDAPTDNTKWTTMSDAIVTAEKACISPLATIVLAVGYAGGSDVPVFTKSYSTPSTMPGTGGVSTPGDAAALVRYSTARRTSKNHPYYLFNYYHVPLVATAGPYDTVLASMVTALGTYASSWVAGFSDGSVTHKRSGPTGDVATGQLVSTVVTHRDFPRG